MPDFRPFSYGQAVSQGQSIAANALNLRQGVRSEQGMAAVNALAQRGITGQQKYKMLSQSGFGDVAQTVPGPRALIGDPAARPRAELCPLPGPALSV